MAEKIWHGACGQWWTGTQTSHCGGCHRNFAGLTAFERHRRDFACLDPATALNPRGKPLFEAVDKPYGLLWRLCSSGTNPWASPPDS